jgi:hypothetical protein
MMPDSTRLLPTQVIIVAGLTETQLKDRRRFDPPKPPHPLPREKGHPGLWYDLGGLRAYLDSVKEQAEVDAELGRNPFEHKLHFSAWVGTANIKTRWPFAMVGPGPTKRPVDLWATIRGEVAMGRSDPIRWLTLSEYLDARLRAAVSEQRDEDRKAAVGTATKRVKRAGTVKTSATARERARS